MWKLANEPDVIIPKKCVYIAMLCATELDLQVGDCSSSASTS
jgi:hypothetical protein